MIGLRFGRWVVIGYSDLRTKSQGLYWECVCDCGTQRPVSSLTLKNGTSKSCGCLKIEVAKRQFLKHGHENNRGKTRTYTSWDNMVQRCTNPNRPEYKHYGGRGITICQKWRTFENFYSDMGDRPNNRSLDRINNDGNYEPDNCRWATRSQQVSNRRKYKRTRKIQPERN